MGLFGSGGLLGGILDPIFGGVDEIGTSGAFQGVDKLGGEFSKFLLKRLQSDPAESKAFRLGTEAIRERVGGVAGAQRQRLGSAATTGGFLDSGSVSRGLADIDRGELQAFSGATTDLLMSLIDRQTQGILPFLSGGAGEAFNIGSLNAGIQQSQRDFNFGVAKQAASAGFGGGIPF